jgi:hypothetical protein
VADDTAWVSTGSCADLSGLAEDSMWCTSQAGGNMQSSAKLAMTAPGSEPVDPVPDRSQQGDPHVDLGTPMATGTDGKPQARMQESYTPSPVRWGPVTVPEVIRK